MCIHNTAPASKHITVCQLRDCDFLLSFTMHMFDIMPASRALSSCYNPSFTWIGSLKSRETHKFVTYNSMLNDQIIFHGPKIQKRCLMKGDPTQHGYSQQGHAWWGIVTRPRKSSHQVISKYLWRRTHDLPLYNPLAEVFVEYNTSSISDTSAPVVNFFKITTLFARTQCVHPWSRCGH